MVRYEKRREGRGEGECGVVLLKEEGDSRSGRIRGAFVFAYSGENGASGLMFVPAVLNQAGATVRERSGEFRR